MYEFSTEEMQVLKAAKDGELVDGSATYQTALDVYLDASPQNSLDATNIFEMIVSRNETKPYALF